MNVKFKSVLEGDRREDEAHFKVNSSLKKKHLIRHLFAKQLLFLLKDNLFTEVEFPFAVPDFPNFSYEYQFPLLRQAPLL